MTYGKNIQSMANLLVNEDDEEQNQNANQIKKTKVFT